MKPVDIFKKQRQNVKEIRNGRCGYLRHFEEKRYADAYYELSGVPQYDLLVWIDDLKRWSDGSEITEEEKTNIFNAYQEWANKHNVKCEW